MADDQLLLKRAGFYSVCVAFILAVSKLIAYFLTNSAALLSSFMDSGLDFCASLINFWAIKKALRPADHDHRFGHGKAEAIGGLIQGCFILISAVFLLKEAWERFITPTPLTRLSIGIYLMIFSIVLTLLLVKYQQKALKSTNSVAVKADSMHYQGDILMNLGVMCSIILTQFFGIDKIDTLFAVGCSLFLFYSAFNVLKQVFLILMDSEIENDKRKKIMHVIRSFPEILEFKHLKTRTDGKKLFVQFDALFDDTMTLKQTHKITDKVENTLKDTFPHIAVVIHQEPVNRKKSFSKKHHEK